VKLNVLDRSNGNSVSSPLPKFVPVAEMLENVSIVSVN
jgi:hypothetical protein